MLSSTTTTTRTATAAPILCCAEPATRSFKISEMTTAAQRVAYLTKVHASWPQARVRSTVARELNLSTVQLRYLLRKAAEQGL